MSNNYGQNLKVTFNYVKNFKKQSYRWNSSFRNNEEWLETSQCAKYNYYWRKARFFHETVDTSHITYLIIFGKRCAVWSPLLMTLGNMAGMKIIQEKSRSNITTYGCSARILKLYKDIEIQNIKANVVHVISNFATIITKPKT